MYTIVAAAVFVPRIREETRSARLAPPHTSGSPLPPRPPVRTGWRAGLLRAVELALGALAPLLLAGRR